MDKHQITEDAFDRLSFRLILTNCSINNKMLPSIGLRLKQGVHEYDDAEMNY